jgi:prophage antirepressor-like protein
MDALLAVLNEVSANSPLFSSIAEQPKENKVRKREDVKLACYRKQALKCQNDDGTSVFFFVWTLFVQWQDDTIDCWFRAKDVANGLGYKQADAASRIAKFLSDDSRIIEWGFIERFLSHNLPLPSDPGQWCALVGVQASKENNIRTQFLTEEGLYEVYQFCPKCKSFRGMVATILRTIRERIRGPTASATVPALTNKERAEYDAEINQLKESLDAAKREHDSRVNEMQREIEHWKISTEEAKRQNVATLLELHETKLALEQTRIETTKVTEELKIKKAAEKELETKINELEKICTNLERRMNEITRAITRVNFLYFDPSVIPPAEQDVGLMVYIGQLRAVPETRFRPGFLCIRGQRKHAKRTLEDLYSFNEDRSNNKRRRKSLEFIGKLGHDLSIASDHLCDPERKTALETLFQPERDGEFNEPRHLRCLVPCINSKALVRIQRHKSAATSSADNVANNPRLPFRQYGGFPNSNIYVTTAETVEEALTSFEEYSRFYGSIQALDL